MKDYFITWIQKTQNKNMQKVADIDYDLLSDIELLEQIEKLKSRKRKK